MKKREQKKIRLALRSNQIFVIQLTKQPMSKQQKSSE